MKESETINQNKDSLLTFAISEELKNFKVSNLAKGSKELTDRYREQKKPHGKFISTPLHAKSYIAARMPATFSSVKQVLETLPSYTLNSLLDLGAGPGTATWAAIDRFSTLSKITLVEQDVSLIEMGKRLALYSAHDAFKKALWIQANLENLEALPKHDVVIFSYSLGELSCDLDSLLKHYWSLTEEFLVLVEPGSKAGYQNILKARDILLSLKAHIIAPCSHSKKCPLKENDWCHFSTRLTRSSLHAEVKRGSLNYEDEKFSYLVVSKKSYPSYERIIKFPIKRSGHMIADICGKNGQIERKTFSKKQGELYKTLKKLEWGDIMDLTLLKEPHNP